MASPSRSKPSVLLVEDILSNAKRMRRLLQNQGYDVVIVRSYESALNALQNQPFQSFDPDDNKDKENHVHHAFSLVITDNEIFSDDSRTEQMEAAISIASAVRERFKSTPVIVWSTSISNNSCFSAALEKSSGSEDLSNLLRSLSLPFKS